MINDDISSQLTEAAKVVNLDSPTPSPVAKSTAPVKVKQNKLDQNAFQTVGRRKEAIARIRMVPGTGKFVLNNKKDLETYFPNKVHQQLIKAPLVSVEKEGNFDFHANLVGGGPSGQAGALRLAISRALILANPDDRPVLKKAGFLTRDARVVERKKYGLKKARKASQFSKR